MKYRNLILRIWQSMPLAWRADLVKSKFAPPLRRCMNLIYRSKVGIFPLAEPLEGFRMRLDWRSSKAFVFGTYERQVVDVLQKLVDQGWVVLDLGAHVGYFALMLSKLVGPKGKVIAFEPHPDNFRALQENVQLNRCKNVILENRAVAATSGLTSLKSNDDDTLTYTASLVQGTTIGDVETVCIDDYLLGEHERIHFIMMDVEGMEAAVLSGMHSTLRRDHPVILLELHGFSQLGQAHPALQELRSMGYNVEYLDGPGAQVHVLASPTAVA